MLLGDALDLRIGRTALLLGLYLVAGLVTATCSTLLLCALFVCSLLR